MTDSELLQAIINQNDWTQEQLAEHLLFDRSQVSRVINKKIALRPVVRKKAERLFEQTKQE